MKLELMLATRLTVLVACSSKPRNESLPTLPQMIKDQKLALDSAESIDDIFIG